LDILQDLQGAKKLSTGSLGREKFGIFSEDFAKALSDLKGREEKAVQEVQRYAEIQAQAEADLKALIEQGGQNAQVFEVDIAKLRKQIEDIDDQINKFQGSKTDLDKLVSDRQKLQ